MNDSIRVYFSQSDAVIDTTHTFRLDEILEAVSVNCEGINETNYINGKNTITFSAGSICSYTLTVIEGEVTLEQLL